MKTDQERIVDLETEVAQLKKDLSEALRMLGNLLEVAQLPVSVRRSAEDRLLHARFGWSRSDG
jgi:hypothetical protein